MQHVNANMGRCRLSHLIRKLMSPCPPARPPRHVLDGGEQLGSNCVTLRLPALHDYSFRLCSLRAASEQLDSAEGPSFTRQVAFHDIRLDASSNPWMKTHLATSHALQWAHNSRSPINSSRAFLELLVRQASNLGVSSCLLVYYKTIRSCSVS